MTVVLLRYTHKTRLLEAKGELHSTVACANSNLRFSKFNGYVEIPYITMFTILFLINALDTTSYACYLQYLKK